ncbi:MerR family transcriptional regulator [Arthrobacter sp. CG_A4]|uniref:MerR family transcriptional regulator n=1 Tax=Arthrobacter sp. CG_A4 TaxID=3071706 RepID=UPI002DFD5F09|nr:DNA-binding transcriptional MerR regulator [Arthrobacter sp. CG_A4]
MRISQLAAATGVPVATIKYYRREKLLHDGVLTAATQAHYDDSHVRRLKLIRALIGTAGLSVAATRELLQGLENPPEPGHDLLGLAHRAVTRPAADGVDLAPAQELLGRWGWGEQACDRNSQAALVEALDGLSSAGFELPDGMLDRYARAMRDVAEADVESVPTDSPEAAMRYVVLGTVLVEPVLLAMRRLAQQSASFERFGAATLGQGAGPV